MQEGLEANVETIAFTLSETGSRGRVLTYVVTGSLRLLSGEVCRRQGQRQGNSVGSNYSNPGKLKWIKWERVWGGFCLL